MTRTRTAPPHCWREGFGEAPYDGSSALLFNEDLHGGLGGDFKKLQALDLLLRPLVELNGKQGRCLPIFDGCVQDRGGSPVGSPAPRPEELCIPVGRSFMVPVYLD